jgi:hypothetical protein
MLPLRHPGSERRDSLEDILSGHRTSMDAARD